MLLGLVRNNSRRPPLHAGDAREWVGLPGDYRITDMLTGQPVEVQ